MGSVCSNCFGGDAKPAVRLRALRLISRDGSVTRIARTSDPQITLIRADGPDRQITRKERGFHGGNDPQITRTPLHGRNDARVTEISRIYEVRGIRAHGSPHRGFGMHDEVVVRLRRER